MNYDVIINSGEERFLPLSSASTRQASGRAPSLAVCSLGACAPFSSLTRALSLALPDWLCVCCVLCALLASQAMLTLPLWRCSLLLSAWQGVSSRCPSGQATILG